VARYRYRSRPRVVRAIAELSPGASVHVLRSSRAVQAFLDTMSSG